MKPLFLFSDKTFAWIVAVAFLFAAILGSLYEPDANPIPGLRNFSANLWGAWPATVLSAYIASLISFSRKQSAAELFYLSGFSACAGFALAAFVSPGAAVSLIVLSGMLYRAGEKCG